MPVESAAAGASPGGGSWKWWICALLLLATTLNYMDRQALYQTSVRVSRDLGLKNVEYGQLESAFNIAFGCGALICGFLVDRSSLKWVYAVLVFAWSVVGFATGFVTAFAPLLVCRFLLGLFEAGNWPCGILTVRRILPAEQRSLGNGIFQSGTAIGAIITPLVVLACLDIADPDGPRRAVLLAGTGAGGALALPAPTYSWQLVFRFIGILGVLWVVLWLTTVRSERLGPPPLTPTAPGSSDSYWALWRNRRFLVLTFVIVAVNVPWRTFVVWSPKFLQQGCGYSERQMQQFMALFYVAADVGSLSVGFITLYLVRRRFSLFAARLWTFFCCALLALLTFVAVNLPRGPSLEIVMLLIGFAVLGSFPTYFALSQEISARHQGKVTGTLGLVNSAVMAVLMPAQGWLVDQTGTFSYSLGLAGLTPIMAVAIVYFFWNPDKKVENP